MLPNCIGIGTHRSGTTWIYENLKSHPQVFMSPEKEIDFFVRNYEKGIKWYEKYFAKHAGEKIIGEFSPSYLAHEQTPVLIKKTIPNAKLIVSLRNPPDQIYSRYHFKVVREFYRKTFQEALDENQYLIDEAFYFKHIKRYMELFDRSQILILLYDELKEDPISFLKKIYSFLEIDDTYIPPNLHKKIFPSRVPRNHYMEFIIVLIRILLRNLSLHTVVENLKQSGIVGWIRDFNTKKNGTFKDMPPEIRVQLNQIFSTDKRMLSELLSTDLSNWK